MSKTYRFVFAGTREMFLEKVEQYYNNDQNFLSAHDYILDVSHENYRFGIGRGGHSGGYWYEPTIIEDNNQITFSGKIRYIDFSSKDKGIKKVFNIIGDVLLWILLFPLFIVFYAYKLIRFLIRKINHRPIPRDDSSEDNLFFLMENIFGCTRI